MINFINLIMKNTILVLSLLFFCNSISAQLNLSTFYSKINATDWQTQIDSKLGNQNNLNYNQAFTFGLSYWFRLPQKRVEFTPEISYADFEGEYVFPNDGQFNVDIHLHQLNFHTNIYILDFAGDCNCPTFGKQEPIFKKGLFLQVSPGVMFSSYNVNEGDVSNATSFQIGAGIGLDIGLSENFTITPIFRAKQHFNVNWLNLDQYLIEGNENFEDHDNLSNILQFEAGLQFGIRWKKY